MDQILRQKVEILNGERGKRDEQAVRLKYLRALADMIPAQPESKPAAGATPTKAEFDALVKDVQTIYAAFARLRATLPR